MEAFDLKASLKRIAHWLPTQGPIKDFIHHNTLHGFQDRPFHQAVDDASRMFGSRKYLNGDWYRRAYDRGKITASAFSRVLELRFAEPERSKVRERLLGGTADEPMYPGIAASGIRSQWKTRLGVDLDSLVHPLLFRFVGRFLDQGVAIWRMPHVDAGFWNAVCRLARESWWGLAPLTDKPCLSLLSKSPAEVIAHCLPRLVASEKHYERYLLEMLLSHPGWSGMVACIEANPASLLARRNITLEEMVALEVLLEVGFLGRDAGTDFHPLDGSSFDAPPDRFVLSDQAIWQEALEWSLYEQFLGALEVSSKDRQSGQGMPAARIFFCLDDRSSSLRRHVEELEPSFETVSTAGFFWVDFLYQGLQDAYPVQHCPVIVKPKHLVREFPSAPGKYKKPRLSQLLHLAPSSNTLFRGWIITQTLGLWSSIRLAVNVFRPTLSPPTEKALSRVKVHTRLHLLREQEEATPEGHLLGYSIKEMADRVHGLLRQTGCLSPFPELIVIVAHGASSVNNPHFAAYDCGACSGKPGAPNARAMATMGNLSEVRIELRQRGLDIPEGCRFLGANYDTTRDDIEFFDVDPLGSSHRVLFDRLKKTFAEAGRRNAKERCRRFELVSLDLTPRQALQHVRQRAASIFEPRPEWNHATNAVAIVGRRSLTRGLFLDRRAFLNSYDPETDPDGAILTGILNAVVPVCGGINLEYFFSRVDNVVYGAGSKLPHNVMGLLGVANGVEGDLRTGLPAQMVEIHDPIRLLIVVEQTPSVALEAVRRNPSVFEWIHNEWVGYACLDPQSHRTSVFRGEKMEEASVSSPGLRVATSSLSLVDRRDGIPVARIVKPREGKS